MKSKLSVEGNTEVCFGISVDAWIPLREKLNNYEFGSNEHEIHFFKVIRPLFTQETELYSILHHSELFAVEDSFWQRQPVRMEKFKSDHARNIDAYISNDTEMDELWYCRAEFDDKTSGDEVIGRYLGMIRYLDFVRTNIYNNNSQ